MNSGSHGRRVEGAKGGIEVPGEGLPEGPVRVEGNPKPEILHLFGMATLSLKPALSTKHAARNPKPQLRKPEHEIRNMKPPRRTTKPETRNMNPETLDNKAET